MAIIDLDQIKAQLRIDDDDNDEVLQQKVDAAQGHIERLLGFKLDAITYPSVGEVEYPETVPAPLRECVLELAAHWFERREAVLVGESAQVLPIGVNDIVNEFRNWSWACLREASMRGTKPQLITINGTLVTFPAPPAWLSPLAQGEWRRMQPFLEERKHLNDVDIANLENYCIAQGRVRECEEAWATALTIDHQSKLWRMQNQAMQTARQLAAELGLTPMSRSRFVTKDLFDADPSPLDF